MEFERWSQAMRGEFDEFLHQTWQAMNKARDRLGRRAYEVVALVDGDDPLSAKRAKGCDIGSGPTEASCKTTTARLKGSGMRWDPAGAQAMQHLTALEDSNEWEAYWQLPDVHEN